MTKKYKTEAELIKSFIHLNERQRLKGQTSYDHYKRTRAAQVECEVCKRTECKLYRHRIIPLGEYTDKNVLIVCGSCHVLIHKIYDETGADTLEEYQVAISLLRIKKGKLL